MRYSIHTISFFSLLSVLNQEPYGPKVDFQLCRRPGGDGEAPGAAQLDVQQLAGWRPHGEVHLELRYVDQTEILLEIGRGDDDRVKISCDKRSFCLKRINLH